MSQPERQARDELRDGSTADPATDARRSLAMRQLGHQLSAAQRDGGRFAGLYASPTTGESSDQTGGLTLTVVVVSGEQVSLLDAPVGRGYESLTALAPSAFWYERALHDLWGVVPRRHPRLDPLLLPGHGHHRNAPVPALAPPRSLSADEREIPRYVHGPGLFTIPHGPVRSGVTEAVEYLVETPGEEIPHLHVRIFAKHRAVHQAFRGRSLDDGVLVAERVEGVAGVAHALAYCHAVERAAGVDVPHAAALLRLVHAELERVANHLDVALKLCDAAGLAVATSRFGLHKEGLLRLQDQLCRNRFGRSVVVPGGVRAGAGVSPDAVLPQLDQLRADIGRDAELLMVTSSFLDRLRGTGPLEAHRAAELGALGPVARASGYQDDARLERPYDAYEQPKLAAVLRNPPRSTARLNGDAQARLAVRWQEVEQSFAVLRQALGELAGLPATAAQTVDVPPVDGRSVGWAEAPQGEVMYVVEQRGGQVTWCWPRSASFHNLSLFHEVFAGDILTDFPFIEASFGLSIAGAAV